MSILLKTSTFSKEVIDLLYDKQKDFKKEKGRMVSLEKTVERLLKEAYLKEKK